MSGLAEKTAALRAEGKAWHQAQERGSFVGLYLTFLAYRLLGRAFLAVLLYPIILYFFLFGRQARQASRDFLARVHAHPQGLGNFKRPPGWRESLRHFLSFGTSALDKVAAWMGRISLGDIRYENREVLTELEQAGRGVVMIASHLGNIEVCRALGSLYRNMRINVLVHTGHAESFNRLLARTNPKAQVSLFQVTDFGPDTAMQLHERVSRGEMVVIVGDRTPTSDTPRTVRAPFLGVSADFPQGPFMLAAALGAPVLLVFSVRDGDGYKVYFEKFADPLALPRRERQAALQAAVSRYAQRLEYYTLRYPYQWFNFFDFWATPKAADRPLDTQG